MLFGEKEYQIVEPVTIELDNGDKLTLMYGLVTIAVLLRMEELVQIRKGESVFILPKRNFDPHQDKFKLTS